MYNLSVLQRSDILHPALQDKALSTIHNSTLLVTLLTHGNRSVKKSLVRRKLMREEDNVYENEVLPNEEEVEAVSHISNLRRKPSVVRYKRSK